MAVGLVGWSAPSAAQFVERPELHQRLVGIAPEIAILAGPSGYGKTVAAAALAHARSGTCMWLEGAGLLTGGRRLLAAIVHGLSDRYGGAGVGAAADYHDAEDALEALAKLVAEATPELRTIVVDDCAFEPGATGESALLARAAAVLTAHDVALLLTTRSEREAAHLSGNRVHVLGTCELALDEADAARIWARLSSAEDCCEDALQAALAVSQGHVALFAVLAREGFVADAESVSDSLSHRLRATVERLLGPIDEEDLQALMLCATLGHGSAVDLSRLGVTRPSDMLHRVSAALPLVAVERSSARSGIRFRAHDLLRVSMDRHFQSTGPDLRKLERVLGHLVDRGDYARALRVALDALPASAMAEWIAVNGEGAIAAQLASQVHEAILGIGPSASSSSSRLLLVWAEALWDMGELEESLARARAATLLATHEEDSVVAVRAMTICSDVYRTLGRNADAIQAAVQAVAKSDGLRGPVRLDAMRAEASALLVGGHYPEADEAFERALAQASEGIDAWSVQLTLRLAAMVPAMWRGDFGESSRRLSPLVASSRDRLSTRVIVRGNLAACVLETGRLSRARSLLESVLPTGVPYFDGSYLPVLGCALSGQGLTQEAEEAIRTGMRLSAQVCDEATTATTRVFASIISRSMGQNEDALTHAERAYEQLAANDFLSFRRLAALEVAASLLAMGDVRAARAWAEPIVAEGFGDNLHHATRGAMILAECDRRDGRIPEGIARLSAVSDHIRSENSNWQIAMYCRAFPHMLGMLSAAVGSEGLPAHMLRMILPEHKEGCLRGARALIAQAEWELLGRRLLGDEHFEAYVKRGGRPVCTVRMFGGLEVSVDGKAIREKDWRKRKSRMLFAMLVARRGHDISRDQILEHLWPELDDSRAKNNFYVAWSTMKGALMGEAKLTGPCPYVESVRGRCRVVRDSVWSDVEDFEDALKEMRRADSEGESDAALAAADRLSSIYRGELLPGDLYDDWFSTLRDRYRIEFSDAMLRAVTLLIERDDPCEAVVYARRGIATDPYREDLYQAALSAHIAAGQRSAAIETFLQCRTQLSEELGLDPSAKTYDLYSQVLAMEECPRIDTYGLPPASDSYGTSW